MGENWLWDKNGSITPACKLERRLSNAILICRFRAIFQGLHKKRRRQCQRHSVRTVTKYREKMNETSQE